MRDIKPVNSAGVKFVKFIGIDPNGNKKYLCQCPNCNETFEMWASHYYRGSNSCECEFYGKQYPRLYSIWTNMKSRCYNCNFPEYKYYGNIEKQIVEEIIEDLDVEGEMMAFQMNEKTAGYVQFMVLFNEEGCDVAIEEVVKEYMNKK